ncbi:MAG: hypothetical protein IJ048_02880 [Clostridia bacterium]|nr:hypothetical protein [Clostridia bacterium]
MSMENRETAVVRELAKRYMEIALSDRHVRMRQRFKDSNDLKIVRPPLIMEEIPWHEMNMDGELDCVCQDETLRQMEYSLRVQLFREKHFKCDNYIEPVWVIGKACASTGFGFEIEEKRLAVDQANNIVSHEYSDVLEDESSLERYHDPVVTAHPEIDARNVARAEEILNGIMPVELRGSCIYFAPWDQIAMLRGVEPILIDMYDRPEYLHRIIALFARGMASEMDQKDALGLYDPRVISVHCTPGQITLRHEPDPAHYGCRDIWFRTMAQMFSSVSPAAHDEFDLQYTIPLAKRCAYTYYGCCEPLNDRIDKLKQYPNLRKIGCSPWANVEQTAEAIGGDYVLSRKPNPANVAITTDPEVIRKEIGETARLCLKYGCPCDITLKDISTVSYKPQNLIVWAEAASGALDEYYGEA